VRYVVDRYAAGKHHGGLEYRDSCVDGTALTGAQNIANVTGVPFTTVVSRWALATYVTDGGGIPPELQYDSWSLHAVYSSLHTQKPEPLSKVLSLVPRSAPDAS